MAYDTMGNYVGDYTMGTDYETEEERRRRLEAAAAQEPVTQKITYNPDGTQKVTITGTPQALSASQPNTPTITPPAAPVAPGYNQYIAQNESGANPNIGYHNPAKSTAYGPYGITAGAYQDARRANPALPADITQTTPEQMTQAQNAVTANNARYLQNYGVEPTQNNLAAAHFLGARGLSDYLKTGAVSPAAAAANGGEANVRQIVDQRLGGAPAPASGAVPQQAPQTAALSEPVSPYALTAPSGIGLQVPRLETPLGGPNLQQSIERYQSVQDKPMDLIALANDNSVSEGIRERARSRAADLFIQEKDRKDAEQRLAQMAITGNAKDARELTKSSDKGNWLRYLFLGYVNPAAAEQEGIKLGIAPTKFETRRLDGQAVQLETRRDGRVVGGVRMDGTALTPEEVARAAGSMIGKHVTTAAEYLTDKAGNIYRSQANEFGDTETKDIASGRPFTGKSSDLTRLRDVSAIENARQKARITLDQQFQTMDRRARIKAFEDTNQMLVNRGEAPLTPGEMGLDLTTGAIRGEPATPATATPAPAGAPAGRGMTTPSTARTGETVEQMKKRQAEEESARKVEEASKKKIATEAAEQVAASPDTVANLGKIDKAIEHLDKGRTNIGTGPAGLLRGELGGPFAQRVGEVFETQESQNTQDVLEAVNRVILERTNLGRMTDKDLEFYIRGKPDISTSPARTKAWLEQARDDIKKRLNFAQTQVNTGGTAPAATPGNSAPRGTAANPIKLD